jgi:thiamine biosynthesis lipoprotein
MSPERVGSALLRAMGVELVVAGATRAELAAVATLFGEWERVFSRFRPDSELSRVNALGAEAFVASPLFVRLLRTALAAAAATDGLVDPTLGAALEAAGYDCDFAELRDAPASMREAPPGSWRSVRTTGPVVVRPPGTALDLNGVVKAAAVDEALALLAGPGFVSAGGDLATRGGTTVALPEGGVVRLAEGGLATSGTTRRRWRRGGETQHHLIDPRTGRPSRSRWEQVTVAAGSALAADVAAKAAFLLSSDGPDWLDARDLPGRFVADDGIVANSTWDRQVETARRRDGAASWS